MIAFINDSEEFDRQLRPVIRRQLVPRVKNPGFAQGSAEARLPDKDLTPFIASLLIPGLGHLIIGKYYLRGFLFLAVAVFIWWPPIVTVWPIVVIHLISACWAFWDQ